MKLVLTVRTGACAGQRVTLEDGVLEMGRGGACGLRFGANETLVSRRHATLRLEAGGFRLDDHSSGGTWVNGKRVATSLLRSGDEVQLGADGPRLAVAIAGAAVPAAARSVTAVPEPTAVLKTRPIASLAERGLYDPARDKGPRAGLLGILVVLGMLGAGACLGLLLLLITTFELGPGAAAVGVLLAFAAAPFYLAIWLWLDRYDPEPVWILAGALAWGAGAATFVSGVFNTMFAQAVFSITADQGAAQFLSASISAPIVEEALKGVAVLLIFLFLRREFDGVIDGIAYAGVVALGFAAVENVLYYGRVVSKEGTGALIVVFVLRGVLGPFSHAVFTSMTGIGCGIARQTHNGFLRVVMPVVGYAGAVFLHFLWNTLGSLTGSLGGYLVLYALVWAPLFLVFFAVVIWMGYREARLIRRMLEIEVARGLLTTEQADTVGSWLRRVSWQLASLGDPGRLRARRQFIHAATRLALCYWHADRATAAGGETVSFGQIPVFQRELAGIRAAV